MPVYPRMLLRHFSGFSPNVLDKKELPISAADLITLVQVFTKKRGETNETKTLKTLTEWLLNL